VEYSPVLKLSAVKRLWRRLFGPAWVPPTPGIVCEAHDLQQCPVCTTSPDETHVTVAGMRIDKARLAALLSRAKEKATAKRVIIKAPVLFPGVVPLKPPGDYMALDSAAFQPNYDFANAGGCFMGFPGYSYLSELLQRSEYRAPSEVLASEMTRKWIKLVSVGGGDKQKKIDELTGDLKKFGVQEICRRAVEQASGFGRAQIFISIKGQEDLRDIPLVIDPRTVGIDSLLGFKVIEPIWTTPYSYDSIDPASPNYYKPSAWFVLGRQTHASRLMTIIPHEVPDLLKPAYNFGGLSMTQLIEPYVVRWLKTVTSVNDLISMFSCSGLATDMQSTLQGGDGADSAGNLFDRAELFTALRDNGGLLLINKGTEEFFQYNTPLSGLSELQAQSQEHMAAPTHIPLVKLLGITPTGLNADASGEIQVFYDYVISQQVQNLGTPLTNILNLLQLNRYGMIDPSIGYEFVPLLELSAKELSEIRTADGATGVAYTQAGITSQLEERQRLASDPQSGYSNLDVEDVPEPPEVTVPPSDDGEDGGDPEDADDGEPAKKAA
jgi:phage-related protein (TIGR01555 family)